MTAGRRLIVLITIGIAALSIIGIVGIISFHDIKTAVSVITTQTIPRIEASHSLAATYRDLRLLLLSHITETDPFVKKVFAKKILLLEEEGNKILAEYELLPKNRQDQKELIEAYRQYVQIHQKALRYSEENKIDLAQTALYGEALPVTEKMETLLRKSAEHNIKDEQDTVERIEQVYYHATLSFIGGTIGSVATFSVLVFLFMRERSISEQFEHRVKTDNLTGLGNRLFLQERGYLAIEKAQITGGGLALLYMDLNGFKAVNDTYGHNAGDEILKEVAKCLRRALRESDVIVRMGGDEFVILIEQNIAGQNIEHGATLVAKKIIAALDNPMAIEGGHRVNVFGSIGMSFYPEHASSVDELIKKADAVMYAAKMESRKIGKGLFHIWGK